MNPTKPWVYLCMVNLISVVVITFAVQMVSWSNITFSINLQPCVSDLLHAVTLWGFCSAFPCVCVTVFTHSAEIKTIICCHQVPDCERAALIIRFSGWKLLSGETSKVVVLFSGHGEHDKLHHLPGQLSVPVHLGVSMIFVVAAFYCCIATLSFPQSWILLDVIPKSLTCVWQQTLTFYIAV